MKRYAPILVAGGVALGISAIVWYFATKRLEQRLGLGGQQLEVELGEGARVLRAEFNRKVTEAEQRIRATIADQIAREKLAILQQVQTMIRPLLG